LTNADYPTADALIGVSRRVEAYTRTLLVSLTDSDLARPVQFVINDGPPRALPIADLLKNLVMHGIHHRAQVATMLRTLGHAPGNFDWILDAMDADLRG
jgi:uncharacterized damage-inducible protein DinB